MYCSTGDSNSHVNIANTVSLYISTMDTIRLGIVAVDDVILLKINLLVVSKYLII